MSRPARTVLFILAAALGWSAVGSSAAQNTGPSASPAASPAAARPAAKAAPDAIAAFDGSGILVDWDSSHASLERTPPARPPAGPVGLPDGDPDALRFVVFGTLVDLAHTLRIESFDAQGHSMDVLEGVQLKESDCPSGLGPACRTTPYVRPVADDVDRNHPLVKERSIRASVGGTIVVTTGARDGMRDRGGRSLRVGGPRSTPIGPIERLRGTIRMFMVRDRPSGRPPLGADDDAARAIARTQFRWANALWGQCGIHFGPEDEADIRIVDPPPAYLLAIGCDMGLPASGGRIEVLVDGRSVRADIPARTLPRAAARMIALAIERAGFSVRVSENARIEAGAEPTADVLVTRKNGQPAQMSPPRNGSISSDASLTACLGEVDLADGLDHFDDITAPAGTVEERALVKAFDDGDPSTVEVFMIPAFAGGDRIGESFINGDRSSVRNVVIEDRAGVRADRASFALAHELGHILLNMPGHPDDFGLDQPTLLMDSDSADPSAFGPRRLTIDECVRAVVESGPAAQIPLLAPWPLNERLRTPLVERRRTPTKRSTVRGTAER